MHPGVGRRPDGGIGGTEEQHAAGARCGGEMRDAAVVADEELAPGEQRGENGQPGGSDSGDAATPGIAARTS